MQPLKSEDLPGGIDALYAWGTDSEHRAATYVTTLWDSGHISCTCGGWIFKRKTNMEKHGYDRWCDHLRQKWQEATRMFEAYQQGEAVTPVPVVKQQVEQRAGVQLKGRWTAAVIPSTPALRPRRMITID